MESNVFNEYRCTCGRLLFRGALFTCKLEIKCKKCGKITLFKSFFPRQIPASFTLAIDEAGIIRNACYGAEFLLLYPREELIGKPVYDICSLLRDETSQEKMHDSFAAGVPYKIKNNVFFVRDGGTILSESYCVGMHNNDASAGYRMFNWIANAQ